jgi:hypothetical protein
MSVDPFPKITVGTNTLVVVVVVEFIVTPPNALAPRGFAVRVRFRPTRPALPEVVSWIASKTLISEDFTLRYSGARSVI